MNDKFLEDLSKLGSFLERELGGLDGVPVFGNPEVELMISSGLHYFHQEAVGIAGSTFDSVPGTVGNPLEDEALWVEDAEPLEDREMLQVGVGQVGPRVVGLRVMRLGVVRLRVVGLRVVGLRVVGLRVMRLRVVRLRVVRLRVVRLRVMRLGVVGLRVMRLRVVGLRVMGG
jgi:hypothetical protein